MVEADQSIFFDLSHSNFSIVAASSPDAPLINPGGVTSVTGTQGSVAPGSIISIYGKNLSSTTESAMAVPLPTKLGTASVTINGVAAPLFYASPTQINAQVPYNVIDELINPVFSEVPVIVTSNGVVGPGAPVTITAAAPGINQDSAGHAVVVNANGTLNSPGSPEK